MYQKYMLPGSLVFRYPPQNGGQRLGAPVAFVRPSITYIPTLYRSAFLRTCTSLKEGPHAGVAWP